jgi:hypothetical protein
MACLRWTLRDSATIGVEQNRPILTPGVQKVDVSVQIARSQEATSWQPGGSGQAVDLGDHRHRQMHDGLHQFGAEFHGAGEERPAPVLVGAVDGQFLES